MDSSNKRKCVIPLVIIEDSGKSHRDYDFRAMVDHNVERLVRAIENSEHGSQVRLLSVHYNDETSVKSQFAPVRNIRSGALNLAECKGTAQTGKAMLFAMDEMQRQREAWKAENTDFTRAVFLLLTDDRPVDWPLEQREDMEAAYQKAALRVRALEAEGQHTIAGCALSQLRMIRCNEKKLQEMCKETFVVRQMPDGMEHMEEGFSDVIAWVKHAIANAWADRPRPERVKPRPEPAPEPTPEPAPEPAPGPAPEPKPGPAPGPAPDDPILRFLGILDEGGRRS